MGCWVLASSYSTLLHLPAPSTHHPAGDLGALPEGGQLAPNLPGVLVLNPGTPLLPGNLGLGGGVTGLGVFPALQSCFWGGDGDRTLPSHGSPTWVSPHTLLPGVLGGQRDAPSQHRTSLAAFHFSRDSRANQGDPAQPHSLTRAPLRSAGGPGPLVLEVRWSRSEPCWSSYGLSCWVNPPLPP